MSAAWPIVASGEDSLIKLAIGVLVAIIWVVVQVYQKLTEKGDKSLPPSRPKPPRTTLPPSRPLPQDPPITGRQPQRMKRDRPPQRRPQQAPPPRARPVETVAEVAPPAFGRQQSVPPVPRVRGAAAAEAIVNPATGASPRGPAIGALLKPRNLRKAFILTEVLSRPVALRTDTDRNA